MCNLPHLTDSMRIRTNQQNNCDLPNKSSHEMNWVASNVKTQAGDNDVIFSDIYFSMWCLNRR